MPVFAGESIWFHEWDGAEHVQWPAIVRTTDGLDKSDVNLTWFDSDGKATQENGVDNVEAFGPSSNLAGNDYWRTRYSDPNLAGVRWPTTRVEKGDMVVFRKWNVEGWTDHFAACVATLGAPSLPHPSINLRWVDDGTETLVSNVSPSEDFDDHIPIEGNDVWANVPTLQMRLEA